MNLENIKTPWITSYGDIPANLEYPDVSMYRMAERAAEKYPKNTAYEFIGKKTTYAGFMKKIDLIARSLLAMGVKRDDKVTICMPNCPQAIGFFYAVNKIGAIANMVHPLSAPGEIAFYINDSKSTCVLIIDQFYYKIAEIRDMIDPEVRFVTASIKDELEPMIALGYALANKPIKMPDSNYTSWSKFLAGGRSYTGPVDADPEKCGSDAAAILYSGGTTGTTKGIILSNLNFNALAAQTLAASGYTGELISTFKMLAVMPLFHGFGLGVCIHTSFISGMMCILVPRFTVDSYTQILRKKKPNFIVGVPTLYEALLRNQKLEGVDLSYLRGVFCGGDSLSVELKKKVDQFLREHNAPVQIREGYGTTECVTASCLTPPYMHKEGSIGIPYPDTYYRITEVGTNNEVPYGTEGEICIAGPSVMIGYNNKPEETESTLIPDDDGNIWLHTGDLGMMDDEGFVYFKQRIKRMIISSGYNVYPSQLENIIDAHPNVLLSCVIGVKDPYKIQKVKAFVTLRPGTEPNEETKRDILAYCKKHIAKYAMPYDIEFRDELPKTLVGKVAYRVLEEEEAAKSGENI